MIRFSSFGDIVQAAAVPAAFKAAFSDPQATQVDWLVRDDFKSLLQEHPYIDEVIPFPRSHGLIGLLALSWRLSQEPYTHVYDAHNNIRSLLVCFVLRSGRALASLSDALRFQKTRLPKLRFAKRPKDRLRRWLFFNLRLPVLPRPFRGAESFHRPLQPWGIPVEVPSGPQFFANTELPPQVLERLSTLPRPHLALAPSAAWEMKRWPLEHWEKLTTLLPDMSFLWLGGPEDDFIESLAAKAPERSLNLAGKLNLSQSSSLLNLADLVIANDTGLLHVADQLERPTIALIGPTAFGYPSHATSRTLEIELPCKPCSKDGRGGCSNSLYKRCLVELTPERVAEAAREALK